MALCGCRFFFVLPCAVLLFCPTSYAQANVATSDAKGLSASAKIAQVGDTSHCQSLGAGGSRMAPLSQVCQFALTYLRELPDFVCEQTINAEGRNTVLKEQVTFENGHEYYADVPTNGKAFGESSGYASPSLGRMKFVSSGELGTILVHLFAAPVVARFQFRKQVKLRNVRASVYAFDVPASENTFWMIRDDHGTMLRPEYKGELWVEYSNGRLLRLDLQPVHLPKHFGIASAQTTIDYNEVPITDAGVFLLPSESQTTVCARDWFYSKEKICSTNGLTFQDCRKFGTKTRILFDDLKP